ncbi:MAG: hypothetical protein MI862_04165, partial [Desulfobacterales bacterium]|nr:hypothetical protein [Desulfobacterales bacterium]
KSHTSLLVLDVTLWMEFSRCGRALYNALFSYADMKQIHDHLKRDSWNLKDAGTHLILIRTENEV